MSKIEIEVKGLDKIMAAFDKFPNEIRQTFKDAGKEAGTEIIETTGLKKYPPKTAANAPPTPYYIRGTGTQYKSRNRGESEDYKSQFYVKPDTGETIIGNRASYAKYLADEKEQATHMARIGWRKLIDVAREKLDKIKNIYDKWVQRTIDKLGL